MIEHVAIVSQSALVSLADVAIVSAAIQKQVARDFSPVWSVAATVDAFERLEHVPVEYSKIIVRDDINSESDGLHRQDETGQPFGLVRVNDRWSLTASHEILEMLADPAGNKLVAGNSVKAGQGRVSYLVEVCDPCEAASFAYTVNGIAVSDFIMPAYFDPVANNAIRYSFTGAVTAPRQVLDGGYLTWLKPDTQHLWQLRVSDGKRRIQDLGVAPPVNASLRMVADRASVKFRKQALGRPLAKQLLLSPLRQCAEVAAPRRTGRAKYHEPMRAAASRLQRQINSLCRAR